MARLIELSHPEQSARDLLTELSEYRNQGRIKGVRVGTNLAVGRTVYSNQKIAAKANLQLLEFTARKPGINDGFVLSYDPDENFVIVSSQAYGLGLVTDDGSMKDIGYHQMEVGSYRRLEFDRSLRLARRTTCQLLAPVIDLLPHSPTLKATIYDWTYAHRYENTNEIGRPDVESFT